ncbi:hypothetical protein [Aequorivita viscosa]|uniref:Uncharacterized protein n=1 Tax=Aequorivita viscosa TaxID=797419 RepID=A0A1M6LPV3_9FLAO|nr:hypothetical protein [Aequorivita viscosa]SDX26741.1 hypothetical protein SAMN05216556_12255 [Aequorivita viscosa]SHJ73228.1 hypothetical protein SAMN04487908_1244 [Aequorivita viscosa]
MKKIIALIAFIFVANIAFSQTVNDVPLSDIPATYVQIVGSGKMFSSKLNIQMDFGQKDSMWSSKEHDLKDKDGNKLEFNSMIDALNFMEENGYEFETAYTLTNSKGNSIYHFLLKKK